MWTPASFICWIRCVLFGSATYVGWPAATAAPATNWQCASNHKYFTAGHGAGQWFTSKFQLVSSSSIEHPLYIEKGILAAHCSFINSLTALATWVSIHSLREGGYCNIHTPSTMALMHASQCVVIFTNHSKFTRCVVIFTGHSAVYLVQQQWQKIQVYSPVSSLEAWIPCVYLTRNFLT